MAAVELASAYISLIPSTKGMGKEIGKQFKAYETQADKTGRTAGSRLMGAMGAAAKKVAVGAVVGAGVAAGAALVSGFRSAIQQQNIQATVAGLYQDAGKAFSTLSDIKALSKTSPIDYAAYGKAAQSLAYAGVEGDQAVTVLDKVGWAIVGAGGGAVELDRAMAGVLKGVNNGGIAMNDTLSMISESGYPIINGLQEHFGVTGDVIKQMAADGEISIDDVLTVMEDGVGDLAKSQAAAGKEVAKTFGSQWLIAKDNISTAIGETMLPLLEKVAPAMEPISQAIVGGIEKIPGIFDRVATAARTAWGVLQAWAPMIFSIVGAVAAWNIVQGVSNALSWAAYLWQSRYVIAGAARVAITNAMTLAQQGLNAAMRANPIGLIITAIMLLVGAFVTAYNNLDWFKNLVNTAWAAIKAAIDVVVQWFTTVAWPAIQAALTAIGGWFTWLWQDVVVPAWNAIWGAISPFITWFSTVAWPWIQTAVTAIGNWFVWLWQSVVVPAWNGIWGAIQTAWTFIKPIFDFIVNAIVNYLIVYFQVLWTFIQIAWKGIQIAIQVAWNIIQVIFNAIVAFVNNVLAPIFMWFWNWIIKPAWAGIQLAIQLAWGLIQIIFKAIVWYVQNVLGPIFTWLWNNIIKPVWNGIKTTIQTIWNFIRDYIFTPIKRFIENTLGPAFTWFKNNVIDPVWDGIKSTIRTVWHFIRDNVFDPLKKAITETVPNAFETGKDAIAEAWDKVKEVAKTPVKFVIDTVINKGIIDNFNKIADIFDVDKIDHVSLPEGFARGGWTGAGSKYKPAGIVHADEFVVKKSSRRRFERENPGALDHLNRTGRLPTLGGYAGGGRVGTLWDAAQWWISKGARAGRHSWFNGGRRITSGHSNGSLHYSDQAVDFNYGPGGTNATEQNFFDRHLGQFQSLFPGIRTIWKASDGSHWDHLHIDTSNGANMGEGGGGGFSLDFLTKPFTDLVDTVTAQMPGDGEWSGLLGGAAKKAITWPVEWIKDNLARVGEMVHDAGEAVGRRAVKESVRSVAMLHGWGFGSEWNALDELIRRESTWNPNAANPTSTARGLFQKMTSIHGPLESTVFGQAQWGLDYIKDRYGSPSAALRFHDRNNHYATGGRVKPTLYDKGGVLQPGTSLVANQTRKPEYILPARVTDALMNGTASSGGRKLAEQIVLQGSPEETFRELDRRERKRDLLYAR